MWSEYSSVIEHMHALGADVLVLNADIKDCRSASEMWPNVAMMSGKCSCGSYDTKCTGIFFSEFDILFPLFSVHNLGYCEITAGCAGVVRCVCQNQITDVAVGHYVVAYW